MTNGFEDRGSGATGGDDELQRELDEALGSMSLGSLMDVDAPGAPSGTGQGVRKGKVIAVHRGDIFVDLGGKSQGLLTADQNEQLSKRLGQYMRPWWGGGEAPGPPMRGRVPAPAPPPAPAK